MFVRLYFIFRVSLAAAGGSFYCKSYVFCFKIILFITFFNLALWVSLSSDKSTECAAKKNQIVGVQQGKNVLLLFLHCNKAHSTTLIKIPWKLDMFNQAVRMSHGLMADELKHLQALFMSRPLPSLHLSFWLLAMASHFTNNTLIHHSSPLQRQTWISILPRPPNMFMRKRYSAPQKRLNKTRLASNIHLMTYGRIPVEGRWMSEKGKRKKTTSGRTLSC